MPKTDPIRALSEQQRAELLRSVRFYERTLRAAQADIDRWSEVGWPWPSYVVDFDLLHHLATPRESELVASEVAAQRLFGYTDTTLVLGPGTLIELSVALRTTLGFSLENLPSKAMDIEDFVFSPGFRAGPLTPALDALPEQLRRIHAVSGHRLAALYALLQQRNFFWFTDIAKFDIDRETYLGAKKILDVLRPSGRLVTNNLADALNIAFIDQLRHSQTDLRGQPFLLTATRVLLDQKHWSSATHGLDEDELTPFARRPDSALYSAILQEMFPDPDDAGEHLAQLVTRIGDVEYRVRAATGYVTRGTQHRRSNLIRAVDERGATDDFRTSIESVAELVGDPVIQKIQSEYDSISVASTNLARQLGASVRHPTSVQQLFDLVIGLSVILREKYEVLGDAWRLFITPHRDDVGRSRRLTFRDSNVERMQRLDDEGTYLACELVPDVDDATGEAFFIFKWPVAMNIEKLLTIVTHSFYRHDAEVVEGVIGVEGLGPQSVLLELPLDYGDIKPMFDDAPIHWIRVGCEHFDFYMDVIPATRSLARLSVFVSEPDLDHIAGLYLETSARFLEASWIRTILEDCMSLADQDDHQ